MTIYYEEIEDVYNHIHFMKVPTVQICYDEYGVIMKQHEDNIDNYRPLRNFHPICTYNA